MGEKISRFIKRLLCAYSPWHEWGRTGYGGIGLHQIACGCGLLWCLSEHPEHHGNILPWDDDFEDLARDSGWVRAAKKDKAGRRGK